MGPDWKQLIELSPEVSHALTTGVPVVALESAVISHGLPHPTGIETAVALEQIVKEHGATPATIAAIGGRIKVGVRAKELEELVRADVMKLAGRDLPVALALARTGGTTVSATLAVADAVGIRVLSTGGIGGVHLGAEESWDVSADLPALARHPLAVVCAGAKAICDVARTLEYLDTAGVTVVAYRTDRFPNFYSRDSGYDAPRRIESVEQAARILGTKRILGQRTALVIANPIPAEDALAHLEVDEAVRRAVEGSRIARVRAGDLTPYLLAAITQLTSGRSLHANLVLLRANAALAASIAVAIARLGYMAEE